MKTTNYAGIKYGGNTDVNKDKITGIRYGVISQNEVLQAWADSSEANYGKAEIECPKCNTMHLNKEYGTTLICECGEELEVELDDFAEPISFYYDKEGYLAECSDNGDIFIMKSPYFTYAQFCSPCAPNACYLMNPLDSKIEDNKAYCFGLDWFEDNKAPYPVYSVETGELLNPT